MKTCPKCHNQLSENSNFCNVCGSRINPTYNNYEKLTIAATILTIIFLLTYILAFKFTSELSKLGASLSASTPSSATTNIRDFTTPFIGGIILAIKPYLLALTFSIMSKKKFLIRFNLIFLLVHIIFMFF